MQSSKLLSCVRTPLPSRNDTLGSSWLWRCPGRQPIQTKERKEGAVLAWQAAALELATHPGNCTELSQNFTKAQDCLVVGPVLGKATQEAIGSWSAQCHNGWLGTSSSRDAARPSESKNKSLLLSQSSRPFHRVHSWSPAPGVEIWPMATTGLLFEIFPPLLRNSPENIKQTIHRPSGLSVKRGFLNPVYVP